MINIELQLDDAIKLTRLSDKTGITTERLLHILISNIDEKVICKALKKVGASS